MARFDYDLRKIKAYVLLERQDLIDLKKYVGELEKLLTDVKEDRSTTKLEEYYIGKVRNELIVVEKVLRRLNRWFKKLNYVLTSKRIGMLSEEREQIEALRDDLEAH